MPYCTGQKLKLFAQLSVEATAYEKQMSARR